MIDIKSINYIVLSADYNSFSRAAKHLGLKQSTLSKCVRNLELRLGVALFRRSTRGAVPTCDGEKIIALSRKILNDLDQVKSIAASLRDGISGRLTAGFHISLSSGNLRTILLDYGTKYPDLNLSTIERDREGLIKRLDMGVVDICFLAGDAPIDGTIMMPAWSERMMALIPESLLIAERQRIYWSDLRDHTFLVSERDPGPELVDMIVSHLCEPGFRPNIVVRDLSPENVLHIAGAAGMVTIVGQSASGTIYPNAVFRELFELNAPSQIGFSAYWRKDNSNPALDSFVRFLRSRYS